MAVERWHDWQLGAYFLNQAWFGKATVQGRVLVMEIDKISNGSETFIIEFLGGSVVATVGSSPGQRPKSLSRDACTSQHGSLSPTFCRTARILKSLRCGSEEVIS